MGRWRRDGVIRGSRVGGRDRNVGLVGGECNERRMGWKRRLRKSNRRLKRPMNRDLLEGG